MKALAATYMHSRAIARGSGTNAGASSAAIVEGARRLSRTSVITTANPAVATCTIETCDRNGRLPNALRGILAGEAAVPRALVTRVVEECRGSGARRLPVGDRIVELSAREWEILELLADGSSTNQVGNRLFISPVTVRRHVSTLVRKLRVADRDEAVRLFRERSAGS
jgi:DNA-binding NarL/FixJ family response regulator